MAKIKHGFSGQRLIVYPFYVIEQALNNPLVADLVVHSMGYFPKAESHYIDRASGCGEYLLIYCTKERAGTCWMENDMSYPRIIFHPPGREAPSIWFERA